MKNLVPCKIIIALIVMAPLLTYSQNTGVNTTGTAPNSNAILDLNTGNTFTGAGNGRGLYIPNVSLASTTDVSIFSAPPTSLLVYNTNSGMTGGWAGFWYWDGTQWEALLDNIAPGAGWTIVGNSGTTAGTNFLGTTDAIDFVIKTNNSERARIASGGPMGIGTSTPSTNYAGNPSNRLLVYSSTLAVAGDVSQVWHAGTAGVAFDAAITNSSNPYNAIEGVTEYTGTAYTPSGVLGLDPETSGTGIGVSGQGNYSNQYGVTGSIPTSGTWTGLGGYFSGGLGYVNGLYNLSDSRVKKNIEPIDSSLKKLVKLQGITYQYNTDVLSSVEGDTRTYMGFIAQDVEKVFPWAVTEKNLPVRVGLTELEKKPSIKLLRLKMVDYTSLIPVIVEAVKAQQKEIKAIQFTGSGQLVNGHQHIEFDNTVTQSISNKDFRVFIQLEGDCKGVYVTNITKTGFDIIEFGGGTSNANFFWQVIPISADTN